MLFLTPFITVYCCILAAVLGACMGSFLNCMAWRIVHGESVLRGRSHCDHCGHTLGAGDLVPIFSYLFLRGRCRYCGEKTPVQCLWTELISSAVFVSLLLKFDISLQALEALLFACILLGSAFADLEGYIIPDRFVAAGIAVRAVFVALSGDVAHAALDSVIGGGSIALALLAVVLLIEKRMKREAMGGGDLKLLFVTGLFLGWQKNLLCLFLACILGIVFGIATAKARAGNEDAKIFPWGPSIALAAWLSMLFGEELIGLYLGLFGL